MWFIYDWKYDNVYRNKWNYKIMIIFISFSDIKNLQFINFVNKVFDLLCVGLL